MIRLLPIILLCSCTEPQEQPATPSVHDLDCYAKARQQELLTDVERWDPKEAFDQYNADQGKGLLPPGCWASSPPKCGSECK